MTTCDEVIPAVPTSPLLAAPLGARFGRHRGAKWAVGRLRKQPIVLVVRVLAIIDMDSMWN